mgnify:CR=1 FL=1
MQTEVVGVGESGWSFAELHRSVSLHLSTVGVRRSRSEADVHLGRTCDSGEDTRWPSVRGAGMAYAARPGQTTRAQYYTGWIFPCLLPG